MNAASSTADIEMLERDDLDPDPVQSAILDLAHLRRYTLDDMDLQREILGLFRDQVTSTMVTLRDACNDPLAWRMAIHTLKGSARAVGAFRLGDAAERAEHAERASGTPATRLVSSQRVADVALSTLATLKWDMEAI